MSCTRKEIVAQAQEWIGLNESNGSFKKIIDIYNSHKPLARGYTLRYDDEWCSGFASACAIACNATDIIPTEVGCAPHINLFKKMGIWVENDAYVPNPGDYIFYYWNDNGVGDCTSGASHVGIVEMVKDGKITIIEGNYSRSVKRRTIPINDKFIRGYGVPKYDKDVVSETTTEKIMLDVDGNWGRLTTMRLQEIFGTSRDGIISSQHLCYKYTNPGLGSSWEWQSKPNGNGSQLIKAMQKWAGMASSDCDGEIGPKTIKAFQKKLGTTVDGVVSNPSQMVKALQKWANAQK